MPTPSLFPYFLKAQAGTIVQGGAGTVFIETLELEVLDPIDVEVIDDPIEVEVLAPFDVEIVDAPIDVEVEVF